jgi:hypothetical protein
MPLDTNIPLQARFAPINYEIPQPINTMMSMMKIKQAGQENALAAQKMEEYGRQRTEEQDFRNYLATEQDPTSPASRQNLLRYGKTGAAFSEALGKQETEKLTQQKTKFDIQKARKDFIAQAQRDISGNPSDAQLIAYAEDLAANPLFNEAEKAQMKKATDRILAIPFNERKPFLASQGASAGELKPSNLQVNQGGQTQVLQMPAFGGAGTSVGTYADVPLPDSVELQRARLARAGAPRTTLQLPPQEKAEQGKRGEMLVAEYSDISKAAKLASKILPSIDANLSILDKGFSTGFGTETIAAGAKVLSALGVANADKFATNAQVFQSKATEAVLQKQLEQKGPQTESDAQRIDQIGAQLGKTTAGNRFVLTTAKEQLKRDMEQRNFYDGWWKQNKTYDGAEDAWYSGEGGKSLFDRPALKTYIKTAEAPAAAGAGAANKPSLDSIFKAKRP